MATKSANLQVSRSQGDVFASAKQALSSMGAKLKEADEADGRIVAHMPASIWSWGEEVTVAVRTVGDGTQVEVESKSRLPFTLIDWGRNQRNVDAVVAGLSGGG